MRKAGFLILWCILIFRVWIWLEQKRFPLNLISQDFPRPCDNALSVIEVARSRASWKKEDYQWNAWKSKRKGMEFMEYGNLNISNVWKLKKETLGFWRWQYLVMFGWQNDMTLGCRWSASSYNWIVWCCRLTWMHTAHHKITSLTRTPPHQMFIIAWFVKCFEVLGKYIPSIPPPKKK